MKETEAIHASAAERRLAGSLRMRHEAEHVASDIADTGDVVDGAIGIAVLTNATLGVAVAKDDLGFALETLDIRMHVATFCMSDRHFKMASRRQALRKRCWLALHPAVDVFANKAQADITYERTLQESALAEDLKAIADTDDGAAGFSKGKHRLHNWSVRCHGPSSQVIAVAEAAGHDESIDIAKALVFVPDHPSLALPIRQHLVNHVQRVFIAIAAREANDAEGLGHQLASSISIR